MARSGGASKVTVRLQLWTVVAAKAVPLTAANAIALRITNFIDFVLCSKFKSKMFGIAWG